MRLAQRAVAGVDKQIGQLAAADDAKVVMRAAAPDLVELTLKAALSATAKFAVVTLAGRSEAPALPIVRGLMQELLRDG